MSRNCLNNPNSFCYVCGEMVVKKAQRKITENIKIAYEQYFVCKLGDQDKYWAPQVCCSSCARALMRYVNTGQKDIPFTVPMIWREPSNHSTDCYFCLTNIHGHTKKNKKKIAYPNIVSATRPVREDQTHVSPVPTPTIDTSESTSDDAVLDDPVNTEIHRITQSELNDLVRDLNLTKEKAEILGSRLQQWNLLEQGTTISHFRKRSEELQKYFLVHDNLSYCPDTDALYRKLKIQHRPEEWRLFIDSSKRSLKAVLLHVGNIHPSIPIAYGAKLKETYDIFKMLFEKINYTNYNWHVCADLKVIAIVTGLQAGYTKYCCFLCEWDSRARTKHYTVKTWPERQTHIPGHKNVKYERLVLPNKIYLHCI